jgi:transposase
VAEALEMIGVLYRIEADIRKNALEGQAKLDYRSRHSVAVVEGFFGWVDQQRHRLDLLPRDPFAKALGYAAEREASLRIFLGDPDVPIDTNHLERALRVVPMGRRYVQFVIMCTFASDLQIPEDRLAKQCGFASIIYC